MNIRPLALLLSFSVGFLSLSQEIVWVRLMSFALKGRPFVFATVLMVFLLGIALGSMLGRRICERSPNVLRDAGRVLVAAALIDFVALYLTGIILDSPLGDVLQPLPRGRDVLLVIPLIAVCACAKGILFPIVHHLGTKAEEGKVGRSVSKVYLGNVLGATLGPIVTGYFLLDVLSTEQTFALVGAGTALLGLLALGCTPEKPVKPLLAGSLALVLGLFLTASPPPVIEAMTGPVHFIEQNRHGIVHVRAEEEPGFGDITYGGNVYDGRLSANMDVNANHLERAYVLAAIHPAPKRVLVIGLSSGAWTRVIQGFPGVERIDVVEINPAYMNLIEQFPEVAPILKDVRVHVSIDDGRRWLRSHPGETYDLIFQNTSYHWRAYMTRLLSQEYFTELRQHLRPGGIIGVNTTASIDVVKTATAVYPHVAMLGSFVYMSDAPLRKRPDAEAVLRAARIGERPAFSEALFKAGGIGEVLANAPLVSGEEHLRAAPAVPAPTVITDANLVTEYRHSTLTPVPWLTPLYWELRNRSP